MIEQRENLELFYINDKIEEQNRILRQINDFIIVLSKILCEHVDTQVNLFFSFKKRSNLFIKKLLLVYYRTTY
jgi:hypothetical protein